MPGPVVVALGGNAIAPAGTGGTAAEQTAAISRVMDPLAAVVARGADVVLTHGNGPQVGNLLLKNELARDIVPSMPLDWCVAQTQATIGVAITTALGRALAVRGVCRPVVPLLSRILVAGDDPSWSAPTKPIGPFAPEAEALRRVAETGQHWAPAGPRGWRRVVPSPEPLALLDRPALDMVRAAGAVVVTNGGGGIPMVDEGGWLRGVEAVVDKDLGAARLALDIGAARLVILTDVPGIAVNHGLPSQEWLVEVTVDRLRTLQSEGHFAIGSMGPKVEASLRFVEGSGGEAAVAAVGDLVPALERRAGTRVVGP